VSIWFRYFPQQHCPPNLQCTCIIIWHKHIFCAIFLWQKKNRIILLLYWYFCNNSTSLYCQTSFTCVPLWCKIKTISTSPKINCKECLKPSLWSSHCFVGLQNKLHIKMVLVMGLTPMAYGTHSVL
jgi:hypothetical protein